MKGMGGQNVKIDMNNRLSFAYMCNGLKVSIGDLTTTFMRLQKAVYDSLEEEEEDDDTSHL